MDTYEICLLKMAYNLLFHQIYTMNCKDQTTVHQQFVISISCFFILCKAFSSVNCMNASKTNLLFKSMLNINRDLQFKAFVWSLHGHTLHCCWYSNVFSFYRILFNSVLLWFVSVSTINSRHPIGDCCISVYKVTVTLALAWQ